MKCIKDNIVNSFEINKSIFITDIVRVNSLDEANSLINKIKLKHKDATHYCYAYIIDNLRKSSDDGEPGGTAGVPIMEVLLKNELNYILCVVTRYFGGIKLGASGLVRAYRNSIVEALKLCKFYELVDGYKRISAINSFMNGDIEYNGKVYSELSSEEKELFDNYHIGIFVG